jgi:hypothetical protein
MKEKIVASSSIALVGGTLFLASFSDKQQCEEMLLDIEVCLLRSKGLKSLIEEVVKDVDASQPSTNNNVRILQ